LRHDFRFALFPLCLAAVAWSSVRSCRGEDSSFERVASYRALGGLVASTVGPGPTPGSQRVYASYLYMNNTLDIVAIDPNTGAAEVFHNPVPGEFGARNVAVGPDGDIYFGTLPNAHFLRLDPRAHRLVDLGRPSLNEQYIWDITFGADGKLYGVTYPGCRLVRYDPATGKLADLGRMDPTEQYGRWIVADRQGYLYMGIGTAKANVAVYDTRTGSMSEVLPKDAQIVATARPFLGANGKVYATVGSRLYELIGFTAREVPPNDRVSAVKRNVLRDGRIVTLGANGIMTLRDPKTHQEKKLKIAYKGEGLELFRISFGPDGALYGSSILPIHFVKFDLVHHDVDEIGMLGGGEVYSFLAHGKKLLMGTYSGMAPLMIYDPSQPFHPDAVGNPELVNFPGSDEEWRPQAMLAGKDGKVYVGATAGYGKLQGPLVEWDAPAGPVLAYDDPVRNQSIVSLTSWNGDIAGGTTIEGGGGSHPTETDARVLIWSLERKRTIWDVIPVPGATTITDLITAKSGLIYGIAINHGEITRGDAISHGQLTLFTLDPIHRKILATNALPFRAVVYNSVEATADGAILGLAEEGIFRIDGLTHRGELIARSPVPISGGFAMRGRSIYFVSGSDVYRCDSVSGKTR
jgi:outer membrane protein assembly factor BamB